MTNSRRGRLSRVVSLEILPRRLSFSFLRMAAFGICKEKYDMDWYPVSLKRIGCPQDYRQLSTL